MARTSTEGAGNGSWSKWTPSGDLSISITNPAAHGKFVDGEEYFLDFTPAKSA